MHTPALHAIMFKQTIGFEIFFLNHGMAFEKKLETELLYITC
jgi:hypothetical protein